MASEIKITDLKRQTHGFFSITQRDERNYKGEDSEYRYALVKLILVRTSGKNAKYELVASTHEADRNVSIECTLLPNEEYTLIFANEGGSSNSNNEDFVVSFYNDNEALDLQN